MGLREKVALVIVAVIIQVASANTIYENPFERYVGRKQLKKSGKCYNSGSSQTNYNADCIKYPGSSYANSAAKASSIKKFRANSASKSNVDPALLQKFKKEARRNRKNKRLENAISKPTQSQDMKPFVTNAGAFPEVEYPLTAMDSWTAKYWNTQCTTENYSTKQNDLSLVTQTCRPVKSRSSNVCLKSAIKKGNIGSLSANNPGETKNKAVNQNTKSSNPNLFKNSKIEAQEKKNLQSISANQKIVSGPNNPAKDHQTRRKLKKRVKSKHKKKHMNTKSKLIQSDKENYISCTPKNSNIISDDLNLCTLSPNITQDRYTSQQLKLDSGYTPTSVICESQIENNRTDTISSNVTYDLNKMSSERVAELNSLELRNLAEQVLAQIGPGPEEFHVPANYTIPLFVSGQMADYRLPDDQLPDQLKSISETRGSNVKDTIKYNLTNLYKLVENVLAEINLKQNIPNDALVEIITKLDTLPTDYTVTDTFIPDKTIEPDIKIPTEYVIPNVMKYDMSEKIVEMPITDEDHATIENNPHENTEIKINDSQNYSSSFCSLAKSEQCSVDDNQESNIKDNVTKITLKHNIPNDVIIEIITRLYLLPTDYTLTNTIPPLNEKTELTINDNQNYSLSFCPLPTSDQCSVDDHLDIIDNFTLLAPVTLLEILNGSVSERIEKEHESQEECYKKDNSFLEEKQTTDTYVLKQVQPSSCDVTENTILIELFSEDLLDKLENLNITDNITVDEEPDIDKQCRQPEDVKPIVNSAEAEVFSETLSTELKSSAIKDESVIPDDLSNNTDAVMENSQIGKTMSLPVESTKIPDTEVKLSGEIIEIHNNDTYFDELSNVEKIYTPIEDNVPKLNDTKESTSMDKTTPYSDKSTQAVISNSTAELPNSNDVLVKVGFENVAGRSYSETTPDIEPVKSNATSNINDAKNSSEINYDHSKDLNLKSNDTDILTSHNILPNDEAEILETTSTKNVSNSQEKDVQNSMTDILTSHNVLPNDKAEILETTPTEKVPNSQEKNVENSMADIQLTSHKVLPNDEAEILETTSTKNVSNLQEKGVENSMTDILTSRNVLPYDEAEILETTPTENVPNSQEIDVENSMAVIQLTSHNVLPNDEAEILETTSTKNVSNSQEKDVENSMADILTSDNVLPNDEAEILETTSTKNVSNSQEKDVENSMTDILTSHNLLPNDESDILETTSTENVSNSQEKDVENSVEKSQENYPFYSEESVSEEDSFEYESITEFTTEKPEDNSLIKQSSEHLPTSIETRHSKELYLQGLLDDGVLTADNENETKSYDETLVALDSNQSEATPEITKGNSPVQVTDEDLLETIPVGEPTLYEADIKSKTTPESHVYNPNAIIEKILDLFNKYITN